MSGMRWWLARCHWHETPYLRLLLEEGWEPFATDANGNVFLRLFSAEWPSSEAARYSVVPGS